MNKTRHEVRSQLHDKSNCNPRIVVISVISQLHYIRKVSLLLEYFSNFGVVILFNKVMQNCLINFGKL